MHHRRLITILLASIWLLLPTRVSATTGDQYLAASVDQTDHQPQWQDIGMNDVLAVTGGSTVAPPTTVRVVHDTPTGATPTVQSTQARYYCITRMPACSHCRAVCGYIYLIHCLRC